MYAPRQRAATWSDGFTRPRDASAYLHHKWTENTKKEPNKSLWPVGRSLDCAIGLPEWSVFIDLSKNLAARVFSPFLAKGMRDYRRTPYFTSYRAGVNGGGENRYQRVAAESKSSNRKDYRLPISGIFRDAHSANWRGQTRQHILQSQKQMQSCVQFSVNAVPGLVLKLWVNDQPL